jgi:acyl-CoA-dependent ceramide synthase
MFRYLSLPNLTDATFVFFLLSWFLTRHVGFIAVLLSVMTHAHYRLPIEWAPEKGKFVTHNSLNVFAILLGAIQIMSCIWFYMACKVAYRVVMGQGAEDVRSDDEE